MENLLQEVAAGSAKGWRRWYAVAHAARCSQCGTFLQRITVSLDVLKSAKSSPATDQEAVDRLRQKIQSLGQGGGS
jgi:molybdenum cofactor biosynthesis enzyme MoaA